MMGGHDNEFYNADTTLVVSAYAMYYDAVLVDEPHYTDSLAMYEQKFLSDMGTHRVHKLSPEVWFSEGRIFHSNKENPPADRFIRKWLLKKDIEGRECQMALTIYFNDSLEYRIDELRNIVTTFPEKPY